MPKICGGQHGSLVCESQFKVAGEFGIVAFWAEKTDQCADALLIMQTADTYTNAYSEKAFTHVSCSLHAYEILHRWAAEPGLWRVVCKYFTVY